MWWPPLLCVMTQEAEALTAPVVAASLVRDDAGGGGAHGACGGRLAGLWGADCEEAEALTAPVVAASLGCADDSDLTRTKPRRRLWWPPRWAAQVMIPAGGRVGICVHASENFAVVLQ